MLELIILFSIAYVIFNLIILWKFAVKTGFPGWSLYIPIYSNFVWFRIAGMDTIWFILSLAPSTILYMYPGNVGIYIVSIIFSLIISFCFCHSLARRFGKDIGFAFGLMFLNPIFIAILTLDKKSIYR